MTAYELRTSRGARVMAFDSEARAREEMQRHQKRVGIQLALYRVRMVEERVA